MNEEEQGAAGMESGGITFADIYHVLFRQKWIILSFTGLAILSAGIVCVVKPARYHTEAQLFIRYVVEGRPVNVPGDTSEARSPNPQGAGILDTEAQMIRSLDVAEQVVDTLGPERILARVGGGANRARAAAMVANYLKVQLPASGSVITITYEHADPQVAQQVLEQVIAAYINKHKEMHRPVEIFGDFLTQETQRLRSALADTEQQLREAKRKAGVTSMEDAKQDYAKQMSRIQEDILNAQTELAQHQTILAVLPQSGGTNLETTNAEAQIPWEQIDQYKQICSRLELLSKREQDLLTQFSEGSTFVQEIREQMAEATKTKRKLEQDYPRLASLGVAPHAPGTAFQPSTFDPVAESIQVQSLKTRIEVLKGQLRDKQVEAGKLDEVEDTIQHLQRQKELAEADLKYFSGSLEQSRVEQALGAGKAPNIGVVQAPSIPIKGWTKPFKKKMAMLTIGWVMFGFALAFIVELFLDRSVKRPVDVTGKLRLPLFICIPNFNRNGNRRLWRPGRAGDRETPGLPGAEGGAGAVPGMALMRPIASWDHDHPLHRYYEGLRDRLIIHFEVQNLAHKPKLVGVTSCGRGVGVTSIAAGLASSLSETGDGNVLLVDMNAEHGASQQFYKGKPSCGLEDALKGEPSASALVQSNLYVVTERLEDNHGLSLLPKRFTNLMPKLKASHYDYIIFDLPPVSQTSITPRLARLMDMLLFVIESEKTSQDLARQALALLAESKVNVSAVLNKARSYVPARLHQEFPDGI